MKTIENNTKKETELGDGFFRDVLPKILYTDKYRESFLAGIFDEERSYLYGMLKYYYKKENVAFPYSEEQFDIVGGILDEEGTVGLKLTLPEESDVSRAYMMFNMTEDFEFENLRYFYIAKEDVDFACTLVEPDDFKRVLMLFPEDDSEEDENVYYAYMESLYA